MSQWKNVLVMSLILASVAAPLALAEDRYNVPRELAERLSLPTDQVASEAFARLVGKFRSNLDEELKACPGKLKTWAHEARDQYIQVAKNRNAALQNAPKNLNNRDFDPDFWNIYLAFSNKAAPAKCELVQGGRHIVSQDYIGCVTDNQYFEHLPQRLPKLQKELNAAVDGALAALEEMRQEKSLKTLFRGSIKANEAAYRIWALADQMEIQEAIVLRIVQGCRNGAESLRIAASEAQALNQKARTSAPGANHAMETDSKSKKQSGLPAEQSRDSGSRMLVESAKP